MPAHTSSILNKLTRAPRFLGGQYSTEDRATIRKALKNAVLPQKRQDLKEETLNAAIHRIEDVAMDYLARMPAVPSWPSRSEQRKQLDRLHRAKKSLFKKAALALHPALWPSIALRAEGLTPGEQRGLFFPITGPDGMGLEAMVRHAAIIQAAAERASKDLRERKSKRGPKKHVVAVWFAWRLIPIYESVTGKEPKAYFSENYPADGNFGQRDTPFVRFVAACIEPLDAAAVKANLGEAIYSYLRGQDKKKTI